MIPIPDAVVEAALNAAHGSRDIPLHLWPEGEQRAMRAALEAVRVTAMVEAALDKWCRHFLSNWRDHDIEGNFRRDMRAALEAALAIATEDNVCVLTLPSVF